MPKRDIEKKKEVERRKRGENIKIWLKIVLLTKDKPLEMKEICDIARDDGEVFSWGDISKAVDDLIKEGEAKSTIFFSDEKWGLEIISQ